jgi:enoyl-[acyl-carrier protein] reductase I
MKHDALSELSGDSTYIAAQRGFSDYNEMADAKSLLEVYSLVITTGKKKHVRINTVSQSPTRTTARQWCARGFDGFAVTYAEKMSPLECKGAEDWYRIIV